MVLKLIKVNRLAAMEDFEGLFHKVKLSNDKDLNIHRRIRSIFTTNV